jgi:uncharacterized protein (DUF1800 family)
MVVRRAVRGSRRGAFGPTPVVRVHWGMKTHRRKRARWVLTKHRKKRRRRHGKHWLPTYSMRPSGPLLPNPDPDGGGDPMAQGPFGPAQAERLLWRAGFGPKPGDVDRFAQMGLEAAVNELIDPPAAQLVGPAPHTDEGDPLAPEDLWGHAHCWWLDRMVRSNQPLVERMTLVFHDWFATSNDKVGDWKLMLGQNELLRGHALGSFRDLLLDITHDPAMLLWLDGIENTKYDPNENYGREVMELFTLGADRGAYTEQDVRELARAFTGWRASWVDGTGWTNFRYDASRHDTGNKTIFGQTGNYDWQAACDLCLHNAFHPSFFVAKLWGYFVPTPIDEATQASLQELYVSSGYGIKPVVGAILKHPALYADSALTKPPVVYTAGMLRTTQQFIESTDWSWLDDGAGQFLFYPPNVSGWDDTRWLDTSSWRGRWDIAAWVTRNQRVDPWDDAKPYDPAEDAPTALARARAALGGPSLTQETQDALLTFANSVLPSPLATWQRGPYRAMRQNALRMLILTSSDFQTS